MPAKARTQTRRIPFLAIAMLCGALILIAHIITKRIVPYVGRDLVTLFAAWPIEFSLPRSDLRDLGLHSSMFTLFTLCYRLSWRGSGPGIRLAAVLVCGGWGIMCECLQLFIQRRDFSWLELSINGLTPLLVILILRLFEKK